MDLTWSLVVGLVVGFFARVVVPGKDPYCTVLTMIIGAVGSIGAAMIGRRLGWYIPNAPAGIFASIVGAIALNWGYRKIVKHRMA